MKGTQHGKEKVMDGKKDKLKINREISGKLFKWSRNGGTCINMENLVLKKD